ncbi:hypothetical protein Gpo141_00005704 [Globisporangium polare]
MVSSLRLVLHVLLVPATFRIQADAKKASALPQWDSPQACEWDLKICGDGTWVYPDSEKSCAFPECWVVFRTPMPTAEYEVI